MADNGKPADREYPPIRTGAATITKACPFCFCVGQYVIDAGGHAEGCRFDRNHDWTHGKIADFCTKCATIRPATTIRPLPDEIGFPDLQMVREEQTHGTSWVMERSFEQLGANEMDRYVAIFRSREGYEASYFFYQGSWSCGAN